MNLRNQRGEGLISVMISVAILGVLVITVVTLYQMYGNMMMKSLLRREADFVANQVRGMVSRRQVCDRALVGNIWNGVDETDITIWQAPGIKAAETGMVFSQGRIRMQRVFIRPFRIDADGNSTVESVSSDVDLRVGTTQATSRSGEVVMRFSVSEGDTGAFDGQLNERRAAVMVLVDRSTNQILNCDINEESTKFKDCRTPADAANDGNPCPANPRPGSVDECEENIFAGSVDLTGETKCHCRWTCMLPYYQARGPVSPLDCQPNNVIGGFPCPPETINGTGRGYCIGRLNLTCRWKQSMPGVCGFVNPWRVFQATCLPPS